MLNVARGRGEGEEVKGGERERVGDWVGGASSRRRRLRCVATVASTMSCHLCVGVGFNCSEARKGRGEGAGARA